MSATLLCNNPQCKWPVRRGTVPVLFPEPDGKARAYCSVECFEQYKSMRWPEPHRSLILAATHNT